MQSKKKLLSKHRESVKKPKKTLAIVLVMLLFTGMQAIASVSFIQSGKIIIKEKAIDLDELIWELEKQTGYDFVFNSELLGKYKNLNVDVEGNIDDVLNLILKDKALSYEVENNIYIIRKKEKPVVDKKNQQKQKKEIRGKITDKDGIGLPGATVMVKGSIVGTSTDMDGNYTITVPNKNSILVFSFIGMDPVEHQVNDQLVFNVKLESSSSQINEVVVTGMFGTKKENFTGVATVVSGAELQSLSTTTLVDGLKNLDPSFQIMENLVDGSDPNKLPNLLIRGRSSFDGASTIPTFILDGAYVSLEKIFDLDMERVKNVTILKDASATAIYGSKAANGVVLVETKTPKAGKLRVSYNSTITVAAPDLSGYNLMNAAEKLEYEKRSDLYFTDSKGKYDEMRPQRYYSESLYEAKRLNVLRGVDTYWLSKPLRTPVSHKHSLYIEGGTKYTRYGLTANYGIREGIMKGSDRTRGGLSFNFSYNLQGKLFFRNTIDITKVNNTNSPYGSFSNYAKQNPYNNPEDENGNQRMIMFDNHRNPLYEAGLSSFNKSEYITIRDNFSVDWMPTKEIRVKSFISYSETINQSDKYTSPLSAVFSGLKDDPDRFLKQGSYLQSHDKSSKLLARVTASYNKVIGDHTITAGIGTSISNSISEGSNMSAEGFMTDKLNFLSYAARYKDNSHPGSDESNSREAGFFTNINYGYSNKYFADFSYRLDGNSKFGENSQFAPFWSIGAAWNIHKENFVNQDVITHLKLRGSIGYSGMANFSDYDAVTMYSLSSSNRYGYSAGAYLKGIGNPDLKWQRNLKQNIGLDINLFKRFNLGVSVYRDESVDLLTTMNVAPSIGVNAFKQNMGTILNEGIEVKSTIVLVRSKKNNMDWSVSGSFYKNRSEIGNLSAEYKESTKDDLNAKKNGESVSAIKLVRSLSIDPMSGEEIYLDTNGNRTFVYNPRDAVVVGDRDPDFRGTLGTHFRYKNFSLNAGFNFELGADKLNMALISKVEQADPMYNVDRRAADLRWSGKGDFSAFRKLSRKSISVPQTTRILQTENALRFSSLSLRYDFPRGLAKKIGVNKLSLTGNTSDLFRLSNIKEERGTNYPFERSFSFSLRVQF